jgi:hypothetical protein
VASEKIGKFELEKLFGKTKKQMKTEKTDENRKKTERFRKLTH